MKTYLVTGGAGFVGSNFVHYLLWTHEDAFVVNVDALTYAGNLDNIADIADHPRHVFIHADICDANALDEAFGKYGPDYVVSFAAESHVDRSIEDPAAFNRTNIEGVLALLDAARRDWEEPDGSYGDHVFLQVSTDEVYGSLPAGDMTTAVPESTPLAPGNPYAASKAAAELYAISYANTYGLPVVITRCCNNYGPFQHPEKLMPLVIAKAIAGEPIPLYGDGSNMRDWIYVADHCRALDLIIGQGRVRQIYNISADCEKENTEVVIALADELARQTGDEAYADAKVQFAKDRKGHDWRYGADAAKLRCELGWVPQTSFEDGVRKTVYWYLTHRDWLDRVLEDNVQANNGRLLEQWHAEELAAKKQARKDAEKEAKVEKRATRRNSRGRHLLPRKSR